jgi:hypothetical protein
LRSWYSQINGIAANQDHYEKKLTETDAQQIGALAAIYALDSIKNIRTGYSKGYDKTEDEEGKQTEEYQNWQAYRAAAMSKASQYGVDESLISDFT